jgi:hypothetical protein
MSLALSLGIANWYTVLLHKLKLEQTTLSGEKEQVAFIDDAGIFFFIAFKRFLAFLHINPCQSVY